MQTDKPLTVGDFKKFLGDNNISDDFLISVDTDCHPGAVHAFDFTISMYSEDSDIDISKDELEDMVADGEWFEEDISELTDAELQAKIDEEFKPNCVRIFGT